MYNQRSKQKSFKEFPEIQLNTLSHMISEQTADPVVNSIIFYIRSLFLSLSQASMHDGLNTLHTTFLNYMFL